MTGTGTTADLSDICSSSRADPRRIQCTFPPVHGCVLTVAAQDGELEELGSQVDLVHLCLEPIPSAGELWVGVSKAGSILADSWIWRNINAR